MSNTVKTNEKVVVGGALIGGLLLFGFLTNTCKSPIDNSDKGGYSNVGVANEFSKVSKVNELEATVEELENKLKLQIEDKGVISDLKVKLDKQRILSVEREERLRNYEVENGKLQAKLKSLSKSELESEMRMLSESLESEKEKLSVELENLKNEFDNKSRVSKDQLTKLEKDFHFLQDDNKKLAEELARTKNTLKQMTVKAGDEGALIARVAELANLNSAQREELRKKNQQIVKLGEQITKSKSQQDVFVKHAEDLPVVAQALFTDLKSLEGLPSTEIQASYLKYLKKHGASAKHRVKFRSGSSVVSGADKEAIAKLTANAAENTYFFIVGYADKSGSAALNQNLSSKRSTSVAQFLTLKTKAAQTAQAVYLGQTDRFGESAENRVVEIWEIK